MINPFIFFRNWRTNGTTAAMERPISWVVAPPWPAPTFVTTALLSLPSQTTSPLTPTHGSSSPGAANLASRQTQEIEKVVLKLAALNWDAILCSALCSLTWSRSSSCCLRPTPPPPRSWASSSQWKSFSHHTTALTRAFFWRLSTHRWKATHAHALKNLVLT